MLSAHRHRCKEFVLGVFHARFNISSLFYFRLLWFASVGACAPCRSPGVHSLVLNMSHWDGIKVYRQHRFILRSVPHTSWWSASSSCYVRYMRDNNVSIITAESQLADVLWMTTTPSLHSHSFFCGLQPKAVIPRSSLFLQPCWLTALRTDYSVFMHFFF